MNDKINEKVNPWDNTPWESKLEDGCRFEDFDPNSNFQIKLTYAREPGYGGSGEVTLIAIDPEVDSALKLLSEEKLDISGEYHIFILEYLNKLRTKLDNQISKQKLIELAEQKRVLDEKNAEIAILQTKLSEGIRALLIDQRG
ncbi:hypothetical protein ACFLZH_00010 [Patescibacteria group bacterium]